MVATKPRPVTPSNQPPEEDVYVEPVEFFDSSVVKDHQIATQILRNMGNVLLHGEVENDKMPRNRIARSRASQ